MKVKLLSVLALLLGIISNEAAITQLNVLSFGADPTGVRSSDTAFNACFAAARGKYGVYIPGGVSATGGAIYKIKSCDISGVPMIYSDASGLYANGATIIQEAGATNDLFWFSTSTFRPVIRNLNLIGKKETNLRNARTITGVNTRYQFTVDTAPPDSGYTREVFFFLPPESGSDSYHYLGSGMVTSIAGTTVNLAGFQDWFATPTAAGGKLTPGTVACFGERVTESSITASDPTRAGYSAINLTGIGAYLILEDVRFEDWHCDIRVGNSVAIDARSTFHRGMSFAGAYHVYPAGSDHRYGYFSAGGNYAPQSGGHEPATPLSDTVNRTAKFAMWVSGTAVVINDLQVYTFLRPFYSYFCFPLRINSADIASSAYEAFVVDNATRVSVGSLMLYNIGFAATDTYSAILNVNGQFRADAIDCAPLAAPFDSVAKYLLESTTKGATNAIGTLLQQTGFTTLEKTSDNLSQLTTYSAGNYVTAGYGLDGRFLVFRDPANQSVQYGVRMTGNGSATNQFRTKLFAFDSEAEGINITDGQKIGIGRRPTTFDVEVQGDTLINGDVIPRLLFVSTLEGAAFPTNNPSGNKWFASTNASGARAFASLYANGSLQYFTDENGDLNVHNVTATNAVTADTITATTSIIAPLLQLTELDTGTLYSTNGIVVPVAQKLALDSSSSTYLRQDNGGAMIVHADTAGGGNGNVVMEAAGGTTQIGTPSAVSVQFDGNTTAGETRLLLWDVTAGTLKRVSVGANDSGGAGFKLLRVAN